MNRSKRMSTAPRPKLPLPLLPGPGVRALHAESIGRVSPFPRCSALFPQKEAGAWAIHRIAPTRIQTEDEFLALCPPGPRNEARLMIFARNPAKGGTSGPANA